MKRNRHKVLNPVPVFLFRGERSARRQLQRRACLSEDAGRKQMPMAAVGVPCSSKNRYPRAGANVRMCECANVRMCECANVRMCECAMAMLASASNQIKSNQIKSALKYPHCGKHGGLQSKTPQPAPMRLAGQKRPASRINTACQPFKTICHFFCDFCISSAAPCHPTLQPTACLAIPA